MFIANTTHTKTLKVCTCIPSLYLKVTIPVMRILTCDILVKYENHRSIRTDLLWNKLCSYFVVIKRQAV